MIVGARVVMAPPGVLVECVLLLDTTDHLGKTVLMLIGKSLQEVISNVKNNKISTPFRLVLLGWTFGCSAMRKGPLLARRANTREHYTRLRYVPECLPQATSVEYFGILLPRNRSL